MVSHCAVDQPLMWHDALPLQPWGACKCELRSCQHQRMVHVGRHWLYIIVSVPHHAAYD